MSRAKSLSDARRSIEAVYRERTPQSRGLHERAQRALPGGESRTATFFKPYPTYIDSGHGTHLTDLDGNRLLDFTFNSTSMIHGHTHSEIVQEIQDRIAQGTAWNAPNVGQVDLAEMLCERVSSFERMRFTNSGTEANMQAIKAARAFTGRSLIVKMDVAYHGTYEGVELNKGPGGWGENASPVSPGVPCNAADNVLIAPFDDAEVVEWLLESYPDQVAAVVVNPAQTQGGLRAPSAGYLQSLREMTVRHGALLIFDEVITLRLSRGGGQGLYGVNPDLTAVGKIIGGGLPVGGLGGREEIMGVFADHQPPQLPHAGTFNGNPAVMAGGIATLQLLDPQAFERIAQMGRTLAGAITNAAREAGVSLQVTRIESLLGVEFPDAGDTANEILELVTLALINRGYKFATMMAASTVTTEHEAAALGAALADVLRELRPAIVEVAPAGIR